MRDLQKLSDLPQYDAVEDEDFPPLPPPDSPGQGAQDEGGPFADGEEGELSKLAEVPAAKKKGVKRPQPKLDSQRLISERGLPALRTLFDNVRFKGKGHEVEDLRLLMQKMENWAHRLYPKLQFEDFIEKVERLGSKKEVQTCLKRIRLDMPLTQEDFIGEEAAAAPELQAIDDPDPFSTLVHSTPAPAAPPPLSSPPPASLTEEQRQRMELNRQRALERRLARNQQADPSESQTVETSESEPTAAPTNDDLHACREEEQEEEEKKEQEETMEEEEDRKEQEEVEQEREEQVDSEPQQPSPED